MARARTAPAEARGRTGPGGGTGQAGPSFAETRPGYPEGMWLYLIGVVLILAGIVGAFAGGIFTLILIPIGLLVIASAAGYSMMGRSAHAAGGADTEARASTGEPLPHSRPRSSGRAPSSPEALTDARRVQQ